MPGWRVLIDGRCPGCEHRYLQDLPAGHGLVYPTTLDLDTGELIDPWGGGWFARWLLRSWERPDGGPVAFEVRGDGAGRPSVLLNCLDPVYGHALLKLLNASRHLDGQDRALVVIVPQALEALVPDGVAETWIVREPVARLAGWLLELESRLGSELDRLGDCVLSPGFPHPHPSTYDLDRHVGGIQPERPGDPTVVVVLRDDRTWGAGAGAQRENVAELLGLLRAGLGSGAGLAVVGVGEPGGLPAGALDLRDPAPDLSCERRWLAVLRGAELAIGVHGSHFLAASGLARAAIELLPETRFANALQATLVRESDPVLALAAHRTLPGAADLADVPPARVAALAEAVLGELERLPRLMAGPAAGLGQGDPRLPTRDPYGDPMPERRPDRVDRAFGLVRPAAAHARRRVRSARIDARVRRASLPSVVRDKRGIAFELETREELRAAAEHGGHFETAELEFAGRWLRPGMTAVDVGANVGAFTAVFARAVAPGGHVHAFEPLPSARRRLERTIELNGLTNVIVRPEAMSDDEGAADLHTYGPGYESWSSLGPRRIDLPGGALAPSDRVSVDTTTLDHYAAAAGMDRIDLLKVDVEGAEPKVLAGARRLLEQGAISVAIIELSDETLSGFGWRAMDVLDLLDRNGLHPHLLEDGELHPFRIAGPLRALVNVVALSPGAGDRLSRG